jgi:uncharacterized surface protein with fasciclin (FAS1) repeats
VSIDLDTFYEIILLVPKQTDLTTFHGAFQDTGLSAKLCTLCNYTVFAPTDSAVLSFNQVLLAKLHTPVWIRHLEELFLFHVTEPTVDQVLSGDLDDGAVLSMLNGMHVIVCRDEDKIVLSSDYTNASKAVQADLTADNGVVHKLDRVMLPEFVVTDLTNVAKSTYSILSALAEFANVGTLIEDKE